MAKRQNMNVAMTLMAIIIIALVGVGAYMFSVGEDGLVRDNTNVNVDLLNSQEISFSAVEKYNPTTALTGVTYTYYEAGVKSTDTDGTFNVKRGVEYEMIIEKDGYVSETYSFTGSGEPMTGMKFELADFMALGDAITVYNKDGSENLVGAKYAIGTGESKNIEFEISGISKDVFPSGIIVFEANNSAVDDVDFNLGSRVDTPSQFTATSVGTKAYAFLVPEVDSNEVLNGIVSITAKEDVDPADNVLYTIYDSQYFIDSKTDLISGKAVQDSDEADIGETTITGTIFLS